MFAGQIIPFPQNLVSATVRFQTTSANVQTGGPITAEMHIDAPGFDHWRTRRVTVQVIAERLGRFTIKHPFLVKNLSRARGDTNREEVATVGRGGREPDLIAVDHRRGPPLMGQRRFPGYILRFTPPRGQRDQIGDSCGTDLPVLVGATKVWPIRFRPRGSAP